MRCQPGKTNQVYNWLKNKQHCLLCDETADGALAICTSCEAELPWLGGHCQVCALPLPSHGLVCGACLKKPPSFSKVEVPWRYAFPIDSLITRFKHQARWPLGRLLGELLSQHLVHAFDEGLPRPDLLLPVPLASRRQRQRGFNQAALLAQWISGQLQLPWQAHWLQRRIDTPAQQQLGRAGRLGTLQVLADQVDGLDRILAGVDRVTDAATARESAGQWPRVGRNDPCPCGSGQKYKHCHGKLD